MRRSSSTSEFPDRARVCARFVRGERFTDVASRLCSKGSCGGGYGGGYGGQATVTVTQTSTMKETATVTMKETMTVTQTQQVTQTMHEVSREKLWGMVFSEC